MYSINKDTLCASGKINPTMNTNETLYCGLQNNRIYLSILNVSAQRNTTGRT